jgi:hypothetical protein
MKNVIVFLFCLACSLSLHAQSMKLSTNDQKAISTLIDRYSEAREKSDTVLLQLILTEDIDQLVSTGEWRVGMRAAIDGMQKSSASNPGTRTLTIDRIRLLNANCAMVDCRYEIMNADNGSRKMWSSFVVVKVRKDWKITAIRNMLPAVN